MCFCFSKLISIYFLVRATTLNYSALKYRDSWVIRPNGRKLIRLTPSSRRLKKLRSVLFLVWDSVQRSHHGRDGCHKSDVSIHTNQDVSRLCVNVRNWRTVDLRQMSWRLGFLILYLDRCEICTLYVFLPWFPRFSIW